MNQWGEIPLSALLSAVESARTHHVAHVGSHYGLHHLSCSLELLEELVYIRD